MKPVSSIQDQWRSVCRIADAHLVLSNYQPGVFVKEHSHDFNLIGMLIYGDMQESLDRRKHHPCRAFDIGLQPAGFRHSNCIGELGLRSVMILFDDSFPRRLGVDPKKLRSYCFLRNCSAIKLGTDLYNNILSNRVSVDEFCSIAQSMFCLIAAQSEIEKKSRPDWLTNVLNQSLEENELDAQVSKLAKDAQRHPDYFSRSFTKHYGENFCNFKNRRRVCEAARLLANSTKGIADISSQCGFSDQPHMTRMFNEYLGTTPSKLRTLAQCET